MSFVEINPKFRRSLAEAGLARAEDFLACAGEAICIRPDRRVDRVSLGRDQIGFLKKETRVLIRERLSSWWSGYGWTSKSVREGLVLAELAAHDLACPKVLALGEAAGQAFVLLQEECDLTPVDAFLRTHPQQSLRVAPILGRELARMHEAGFYHPDLFAKHVLVGQADGLDRVCLIDWQRTRRLADVAWSRRIADLATLDASLDGDTVSPRDRLRLLASYLRQIAGRRPRLRILVDAIQRRSRLLQMRRRVARQRLASAPHNPQRTVDRYEWHNCPLRLTEPNLAVLPLVKFLRGRSDLQLHRRTLRRFGQSLHELHEAGYIPADPGLDSWTVRSPAAFRVPDTDSAEDVEIFLTSVADLTPSTEAAERFSADDLARLLAFHGSRLSRADLLRVVVGYLSPTATRGVRRILVRRILAARETVR